MPRLRHRRQPYTMSGKFGAMLYRAVVLVTSLVAVTTYAAGASLESALLRSMTVLLACVAVAFLVNMGLYFDVLKQPNQMVVEVPVGGAPHSVDSEVALRGADPEATQQQG